MNHKHFKQILLSNKIIPKTISETKIALKLVQQKEKFVLEDAAKALIYNKQIISVDGCYTLEQYINEVRELPFGYRAKGFLTSKLQRV